MHDARLRGKSDVAIPSSTGIRTEKSHCDRVSAIETRVPSQCSRSRCTIYIVRRTQLYLDGQLWGALHARARREKITVSEMVRQAVRERYLGDHEQRRAAMQRFVGIRKGRAERADRIDQVRALRSGS